MHPTASLILDILDTAALLGFLLLFWWLYRLALRIAADMRRLETHMLRIETALTTGFARTETTLQAIVNILDNHGDQLDQLTPAGKRGHRPTAAAP